MVGYSILSSCVAPQARKIGFNGALYHFFTVNLRSKGRSIGRRLVSLGVYKLARRRREKKSILSFPKQRFLIKIWDFYVEGGWGGGGVSPDKKKRG